MLASQVPANFPIPFANAAGVGYKNTIPQASQIGILAGAASLTDGFPPLNFLPAPPYGSGVPPFGQDMNGIFYEITSSVQWTQAGGMPVYNSTFSIAIGGYPNGAVLLMASGNGMWLSTADNNLTNPDASGAGWKMLSIAPSAYLNLSVAGAINVTLTALQVANTVINLTGAITANIAVIVPTATGEWTFSNNTTGAFTVTVKTAAGTGIVVPQGTAMVLYCDGTNVYDATSAKITQSAADARYLVSGQCRLALVAGSLKLSPFNGNRLLINGAPQTIPAAGITLAATGLIPAALYYIYAYMVGATMTLEASATGHSTDVTTGVEIKTGDVTRTLVGMARPIAGPAFADTAAQRYVLSYFNRRDLSCGGAFTALRAITSTSYVEIGNDIRNEFITWADEIASSAISGFMYNGNTNTGNYTSIAFDGIAAEDTCSMFQPSTATYSGPVSVLTNKSGLSEGYHYVTAVGSVTAGTGTWVGSTTAGARTVLNTKIRG